MRYLFLDLDVLVSDDTYPDCSIQYIAQKKKYLMGDEIDLDTCMALRSLLKHKEISVVITGSWAREYSLPDIADLLYSAGIIDNRNQIVGMTPSSKEHNTLLEVNRWLDIVNPEEGCRHLTVLPGDALPETMPLPENALTVSYVFSMIHTEMILNHFGVEDGKVD